MGSVRSDVQRLLDAGPSARDVIDANQVVACLDYVNRVAEVLGVARSGQLAGARPAATSLPARGPADLP